MMKATTRISKEDRRREIVEAATREFAVGGLHGTPVDAIAKQVGVSQPYLFQLFGTKKELFIAAVQRTFERTVAAFRTAAAEAGEDAEPGRRPHGHGRGVPAPARRPQPPAHADAGLRGVRATRRSATWCATRCCAWSASCSRPRARRRRPIREWLAYGMLMNVVAAMDLTEVDADWARMMCPVTAPAIVAHGRRRGRQGGAHGEEAQSR